MKSLARITFDTSHLSPQTPEHIRFVIEEYLREKGVEGYQVEVEIIGGGTNAK